jgi:hypothetical protein
MQCKRSSEEAVLRYIKGVCIVSAQPLTCIVAMSHNLPAKFHVYGHLFTLAYPQRWRVRQMISTGLVSSPYASSVKSRLYVLVSEMYVAN